MGGDGYRDRERSGRADGVRPAEGCAGIDAVARHIANIRQNLFWAFGYNVVLISLAMGGFTRFGLLLNPSFGRGGDGLFEPVRPGQCASSRRVDGKGKPLLRRKTPRVVSLMFAKMSRKCHNEDCSQLSTGFHKAVFAYVPTETCAPQKRA